MIFADKLILLRKKAGWSQEELADQMNVTRQSVSKWEGAQSVPDLDKMIRLSELFGVSTDYLLKDEIEQAEHINSSNDIPSLKRVFMEEANAFLSVKSRTAKTIAYAAFLCILSPIALLMLGAKHLPALCPVSDLNMDAQIPCRIQSGRSVQHSAAVSSSSVACGICSSDKISLIRFFTASPSSSDATTTWAVRAF